LSASILLNPPINRQSHVPQAYLRFIQFVLKSLKGPFVVVWDATPLEKTQLFSREFCPR
jgi:hypothetical protein